MHKHLYQIYDLCAMMASGPIIAEHRDAPAIRLFHGALAQKDSMLGQYPEHYELRELGTIDEQTGQITAITPRTVATGASWFENQMQQKPNTQER